MYGRATIALEAASKRLTVPVACVLDRSGKGRGVVQVVREGKVHRVKVELGVDNGSLVEVDSGLTPQDIVVLRSSIPLEEGMAVTAKPPA
jgi:multidrug efflux pump subunit AcrA (membrane-fusion protein)